MTRDNSPWACAGMILEGCEFVLLLIYRNLHPCPAGNFRFKVLSLPALGFGCVWVFWALYDEESEEVWLEKKPWGEAGLKYPESI